ncbi:Leucine-rich repeat serine/threonine-protein kinase 2 [Phytophthora boehmeriae]|uniref:Leucine-rich repeat serine/threonine-protein kinase 2 n=1 Tax=Phytophthora boehmeriae TaxID=109152 RepID=A0A8T1W7W4_9STRA|nr:Leucine-rich repeat serine/threonine-protein kinase 2 [Phytophthora boehmeriae]
MLTEAARVGDLALVNELVQGGADIDVQDEIGNTALIMAAWEGHMDVAKYLVEQDADKEAKNNFGNTAMIMAAWNSHSDIVRFLHVEGADKETKGYLGNTALLVAAERGHLEVVKYLVEHDADKESKRTEGNTALLMAAESGHLVVVRYLVENGANSACLNNDNNSALLLLLMRSDTDEGNILPIAKLLLENRTPSSQSNKQGYSARSIAKVKGYHHIAALIKEYADRPRRPTVFYDEPEQYWFIPVSTVSRSAYPLATGGFGKVYRAKWSCNEVVMKEIEIKSKEEMTRFRREVKLWRGLTHPNVVQLFGANDREMPCFMVCKYASKGVLPVYLKREKKEGRTVVWQKLFQVAAGLSYLHQKDIVHGDLKGNNIVMSNDGTAMLTDFGLSFLDTASSCSVQKMKDTLGAMQWRAPEFAMMTVTKPTCKSDVYSLGMCIIEAVIGTTPWDAGRSSNEARELLRQNKVKIQQPRGMTDGQWELVSRMIKFDPDDRPAMENVLSELQKFAEAEMKNEEVLQVGGSTQKGHDSSIIDNTSTNFSTASACWSNREAASSSS